MNHFIRCTLLTGALCMSTYTANADTFAEDLSLMRQHFSPQCCTGANAGLPLWASCRGG